MATFTDEGVSATRYRLANRPNALRALEAIEANDADVLVAWKGSRVARNRLDAEVAKERATGAGGRIESATEPNDRSASGRLATGLFAEFAAYEAAQIGEGWRATHRRRRLAGLPAQGGRRYGYQRIYNGRGQTVDYEPIPDQAGVLAWLYAQVIEGRGAGWLAAELNRRGVPNPVGNLWAQGRVYLLLDSGFAAGLIVHRERDPHGTPLHDHVYHDGIHQPVITRATWDAYRAARRQRAGRPSRTVEAKYPLTGLTRCGDCGAGMWPQRAKGKGPGYSLVCGRWQATRQGRCVTVVRHRVEAVVQDWLRTYVDELERRMHADEVADRRIERARRDEQAALRAATAVEGKLAKLNRAWLDGIIPDSGYSQTRDELLAELKAAQDDVQVAQDATVVRRQVTAAEARTLLTGWDELPAADTRNTLAYLIDHIRVDPPSRPHGPAGITVVVPTYDS